MHILLTAHLLVLCRLESFKELLSFVGEVLRLEDFHLIVVLVTQGAKHSLLQDVSFLIGSTVPELRYTYANAFRLPTRTRTCQCFPHASSTRAHTHSLSRSISLFPYTILGLCRMMMSFTVARAYMPVSRRQPGCTRTRCCFLSMSMFSLRETCFASARASRSRTKASISPSPSGANPDPTWKHTHTLSLSTSLSRPLSTSLDLSRPLSTSGRTPSLSTFHTHTPKPSSVTAACTGTETTSTCGTRTGSGACMGMGLDACLRQTTRPWVGSRARLKDGALRMRTCSTNSSQHPTLW